MTKRRKKSGRVVVAVAIIGVACAAWYFTAPPSRQEQVKATAQEVADKAKVLTSEARECLEGGSSPMASQPSGGTTARFYAYAGLPRPNGYPHTILVLINRGFISGYDEQRKNPVWVAYRLFNFTRHTIGPRPSKFLTDDRTKAKVRSDDYTNSGYDRGHMAPNSAIAQCYGDDAQRETFLLSNIVPQRPALNQQFWRLLEERVETTYAARLEEVWVTTGPIYDATR